MVGYVVDNLYVSSGPHNQVTNLPLFLRAFIDKPKGGEEQRQQRREERAAPSWVEGEIKEREGAVRFISVHVAHIFWFLVRFSSVGFEFFLYLTYVIAIAKQQQLTKRLQVARTF